MLLKVMLADHAERSEVEVEISGLTRGNLLDEGKCSS
jgi:hypothetical protein